MDDTLLHRLWTKAVGTPDYDKSEWKELEAQFWAKRPRWTDTPPTVPGWYWWRDKYRSVQTMLRVETDSYGTLIAAPPNCSWEPVGTIIGQWSGPIPQPEDGNG